MILKYLPCLLLSIAFLVISVESAYTFPWHKKTFQEKYGVTGRLNSCVVCHSKGGKSNHNSYGKSFANAGSKKDSLTKIEKLDSDRDGVINIEEIKTYHYPGNKKDRPTETELKNYRAGKAISSNLEADLLETLRCTCGCDITIGSCSCKLVPKFKRTIRENIKKGKNYNQIKEIMVSEYGKGVLPLEEQTEILSPWKFKNKRIMNAYKIAGEIPHIIKELPCFCFCYNKKNRHEGLLDCFKSNHGARCKICIDEAIMAQRLLNEGFKKEEIVKKIVKKFRKR